MSKDEELERLLIVVGDTATGVVMLVKKNFRDAKIVGATGIVLLLVCFTR